MSQVHLSVYAIHCLCTGQIHLSLTAEKECTAGECHQPSEDCCTLGDECTAGTLHSANDGSCHAPKANFELGIDMDASLVNSPISELNETSKTWNLPLYLVFSNLKIAGEPVEITKIKGHPPHYHSSHRYVVLGEMLC
ncbi:MAG: hypothetical protein EA409_00290 [Saprospirales bacterium]|nr:MAG: hypothetical protein EA409_00290 [Saprospirales bacterium]